jgi:hypothetical protein
MVCLSDVSKSFMVETCRIFSLCACLYLTLRKFILNYQIITVFYVYSEDKYCHHSMFFTSVNRAYEAKTMNVKAVICSYPHEEQNYNARYTKDCIPGSRVFHGTK